MVQGTPRGPSWTSHKITEENIERLQGYYFIKVLELPDPMMDKVRHQWKNLALIVKSLDRRVPARWVAKKFKLKLRLEEPEIFQIAENHIIIWFETKRVRLGKERGSLVCSRSAFDSATMGTRLRPRSSASSKGDGVVASPQPSNRILSLVGHYGGRSGDGEAVGHR